MSANVGSETKCLLAWIGRQDLDGVSTTPPTGPIFDFLQTHAGIEAVLLSDWSESERAKYAGCLTGFGQKTEIIPVTLADPTDYGAVYRHADAALSSVAKRFHLDEIAIHTSPGTSTMAAVWVLLAKTKYEGVRLFKSWIDKRSGRSRVAEVKIPFSLTLEVIPELAARRATLLSEAAEVAEMTVGTFGALIFRSTKMAQIVGDARKVALFPNPVLILGESGTGKELLARAIHAASTRGGKQWGVINCAALPQELLDSELFGYVKGAFTGANTDRPGRFEACNGGTLFLDEVGDMPAETQVRLLRVLQEGEVQRLGETRVRKVDVRIIAATNRDLIGEMANGRFRDDLFYRLAVLVLRIPPLRDRPEDIVPLAKHFLGRLNERARDIAGVERKNLSASAKKFAEEYPWPGNVRELENTLARAFAMVSGETLRAEDFREHVIAIGSGLRTTATLGDRKNVNLDEELRAIERDLVKQALSESGGVKERAAKLLGLRSRQALSHRMRRLGLG